MANDVLRDAGKRGSAQTATQALYLELDPDSVFAIVHEPLGSPRSGIGVVLCPPFGWAELCVHRSVRSWADALAAAGHLALRLDLPGTGDSAGTPRDPERLTAWAGAVGAAGAWLRGKQGCERVVAGGLGLGGMLALLAIAEGAPIDDVLLWGVPRRGSLLLRELRTFSKMSGPTGEEPVESEGPSGPDELEIAGFVLAGETVRDLRELDLLSLALPDAERRRILMLGRDTLPPDARLREHFVSSGAEVTVADGRGYGKMLTHPQLAVAPERIFERTLAWLADAPASSSGHSRELAAPPSTKQAIVRVGDTAIVERPFTVELGHSRLAGVLAMPRGGHPVMCGLLLNAGAVRRIGPNRMWVESARRWAALGVPTLRLDGSGFGDSDGDERRYYQTSEFYRDNSQDQIRAAMDALEACGLPPRFMLAGLCSSAYWAMQTACVDARVRALILVNLWAFVWSEELAAARDARRAQALLRSGAWRDVARTAVSEGRIGRLARTRLRQLVTLHHPEGDIYSSVAAQTDRILDELNDRDVDTLLLLSEKEPLADDFLSRGPSELLTRWPTLRYERIPIDDHIFRPIWAQRHVHEAFDAALGRALARPGKRAAA